MLAESCACVINLTTPGSMLAIVSTLGCQKSCHKLALTNESKM